MDEREHRQDERCADIVDAATEQREERRATIEAERAALARLFSCVRHRSSDGNLTPQPLWTQLAEAPDHLDDEAFAQLVAEQLAGRTAGGEEGEEDEDGARDEGLPPLACDDIAEVHGSAGSSLYSTDVMTDAYATWAHLAEEDDDVATLVACAREESKLYPRPLLAQSLANAPFFLDEERVARAFEAAVASGAYPDLETVRASNDDVYYFSTLHLSRGYARSLAETYSVKRFLNL